MGIFEKSLSMGKLDANRKLADGSMLEFKKARSPAFPPILRQPLAPRFSTPSAPIIPPSSARAAPSRS